VQATCGSLPSFWNVACEFLLLHKLFPGRAFFGTHKLPPSEHERLAEVGVLGGCFWLARREAIEEIGGLDERFFFYAEDIDWCKRLGDAGWKKMFVPEATITHFGGGSSSNSPLRYSIEMLRANLLYWQKHNGRLGRFAFFCLATAQHTVRLAVRGLMKLVGLAKGAETTQKLHEHLVCLRWLLTGKGV
jgi:GT2 family glycosyltransferase